MMVITDWNLFWQAFGAIGSTVGSVSTAIAVIIAVKQYLQPINKKIELTFCSAIMPRSNQSGIYYCLSIKNRGIRPVTVNSIYANGYNSHNLFLNFVQADTMVRVDLPAQIRPEENIDIYFETEIFRDELEKSVSDGYIKRYQKLVVFVTDSLGDRYFCKTGVRINQIINQYY